MSIKVIVLDIDGTLVNSKKEITEATLHRLIQLQQQGMFIALASGRPSEGMLPYAEKLELDKYDGYIIAHNGAQIIQVKTKKVVYSRSFPTEYLRGICDCIKPYRVNISTNKGDTFIAAGNKNRFTTVEADVMKLPLKFVEDFPSYVTFETSKCILAGEPEDILKLERIMSEQFKGRFDVYRSEPQFLELVPCGVDKGSSTERLLKILGCSRQECMTIGDSYNDVTMIEYAGIGVAMGNAPDDIKQQADFVTLTNDEDGAVFAIDKFVK